MTFGLIDDDLTNDFVTINDEQNEFQVHYFEKNENIFKSTSFFKIDEFNKNAKISSIMISKDDYYL